MENLQKINDLGSRCRAAYDKGAKLNQKEALLFVHNLMAGDLATCERLVQTAELVAGWNTTTTNQGQ